MSHDARGIAMCEELADLDMLVKTSLRLIIDAVTTEIPDGLG